MGIEFDAGAFWAAAGVSGAAAAGLALWAALRALTAAAHPAVLVGFAAVLAGLTGAAVVVDDNCPPGVPTAHRQVDPKANPDLAKAQAAAYAAEVDAWRAGRLGLPNWAWVPGAILAAGGAALVVYQWVGWSSGWWPAAPPPAG